MLVDTPETLKNICFHHQKTRPPFETKLATVFFHPWKGGLLHHLPGFEKVQVPSMYSPQWPKHPTTKHPKKNKQTYQTYTL